jgi:hypothetical protein
MLKIKEKQPYIILPKQRYNLSTSEPHTVMSGDFTFFVSFNMDSNECHKEYAIVARPGMHMGIMVKVLKEEYALLSWDFWTYENEVKKWNSVHYEIHKHENQYINDIYNVVVQHDLAKKSFKLYTMPNGVGEPIIHETYYTGDLADYSETPYNLGCGNYSKVVPKKDRLFTALTLYNMGLIANVKYTHSEILQFIKNTKRDEIELSKKMEDLVFYFNFNSQNIYKVWDLSGHCNFIQKNLYIEDEDVYVTDEDFAKDYE